ncbi:MAG TPA: ankyrin repeat domain-containing protein [Candidatus Limnocylindrales bacterium]|nr:ankyrin repeat domain-containing protein [Candidatus Limnocylindrales bacterium]
MNDVLSQNTIDAFVMAAHHDLPQVQDMLASEPALLNENAEWLETAVQAASHVNRPDIITFLLDQGAPLDICTAAVLGRADVVASMLAEYPDLIGATGPHNLPVTYYPAICGRPDVLQLLIGAGANVSAGEEANTALHGAAAYGQTETVRWLLAHDANPYAIDHEGRLPIEVAAEKGFSEIVALLEPYTDDVDDSGADE